MKVTIHAKDYLSISIAYDVITELVRIGWTVRYRPFNPVKTPSREVEAKAVRDALSRRGVHRIRCVPIYDSYDHVEVEKR